MLGYENSNISTHSTDDLNPHPSYASMLMSFLMWMPKKYGIAVVITEVKHILLTDFIKNAILPFLKHHFRKKKDIVSKTSSEGYELYSEE